MGVSETYRLVLCVHINEVLDRSRTAEMFLLILIVLLLIAYFISHRIFVHRRTFNGTAKLYGKTVVITGGNTGIGKATAAAFATRGARVILACRSKPRGEAAAQELKQETGNDGIIFMQLDLASQKSIRTFAENFLKSESRLDLLINNAALASPGLTEDGLGMIFGVNHIGPFLLTNLLLARLKACAPSRVVNVSSCGHDLGTIDFDCITSHKRLCLGSSDGDLFRAYTHSKLCNVLFTHELAKRLEGTNVTSYSLHPGSVRSELGRDVNQWHSRLIKAFVSKLWATDPTSGAQTTLYCALQEHIEHLSGRYFSDCQLVRVKPEARDDGASKKLWEISEKFCGMA